MVYSNPFVALEAYESSDDEEPTPIIGGIDDESVAGGDDEGEGQWRLWVDSGAMWEDEDAPVDDNPDRFTGPGFLEDMERQYDPQNQLKSKSLVLTQTEDDLLDKTALHKELISKAILQSEWRQLFWQVKCIPGQEIQVVFDIMNKILPSAQLTAAQCIDLFPLGPEGDVDDQEDILKAILDVESIPESLKPMIDESVAKKAKRFGDSPSQTPSHPESHTRVVPAPERAFQYLLSFAQSESTIPEAEEELKQILQVDSLLSAWSTAIGKASLEPGTDVQVAFQALTAMKSELIPWSLAPPSSSPQGILSSEATEAASSTRSRTTNVYHLFSAFSIPGVSGSVYLEAYLGEDPQNTPIMEFLRQHP
ncbi:hypothetical protein VKT23_019750 [Stygiomarasmius scandens]|uniref:Uncharacterized protein n=1 Tax=Marasmiellus scandens TaxID=2682957 RepID=A0ABR1IPU2_9AGAR